MQTIEYLLHTTVNELVRGALAIEPELRETASATTEKLMKWAKENNLSCSAVTVALVGWLTVGTKEAQKDVSQV